MCGILGYIGAVPPELAKEAHSILKFIFAFSQKRGKDASGFSTMNGENFYTEKRPISSVQFVARSKKFALLRDDMPDIFIGHTRQSTSGKPHIGRNNHPFNSRRYSLVHNGSIPKWKAFVKAQSINLRSETDSEIIIRLLKDDALSGDAINEMLNTIPTESKIAIAILDKYAQELFLYRSFHNEVHVLMVPDLNTMFFASESSFMLDAHRTVFKTTDGAILTKLEAATIHRFSLENGSPKHSIVTRKYKSQSVTPTKPEEPKKEAAVLQEEKYTSKEIIDTMLLRPIPIPVRDEITPSVTSIRNIAKIATSITTNKIPSLAEMEHFRSWLKKCIPGT